MNVEYGDCRTPKCPGWSELRRLRKTETPSLSGAYLDPVEADARTRTGDPFITSQLEASAWVRSSHKKSRKTRLSVTGRKP
jgi:hypothetical protein